MYRAFRITSLGLVAFMIIAMFAAAGTQADDAGWAERFLGYSAAVNPWLISATIVWAAGEVVKTIGRADSGA